MFQTFAKSGKTSRMKKAATKETSHTPSNMYAAVDFGGSHPDASRRFSGNYGKNAKARNEVDTETGAESRQSGRMFSWIKGDSY